jgi:hypothetical protein
MHVAIRGQPLLAYFALAFAISWAAVLWLIAPTGIPGTGADYATTPVPGRREFQRLQSWEDVKPGR